VSTILPWTGFGSMIVKSPDELTTIIVEAAHQIGERILLLKYGLLLLDNMSCGNSFSLYLLIKTSTLNQDFSLDLYIK
jgi:hypothetical protein